MRDRAIGPIANPAAAAIVYEDVRHVLDTTAGGFAKKFGQDYEESRAFADLVFVQEYPRYLANPTQELETWLRYCVWNQLIDLLRESFAKRRRPEGGWVTGGEALAMVADPRPDATQDRMEDLTEGMSADARLVALLAVDLPAEIQSEIEERGGKPGNTRKVIRQYLKTTKGWTSARVSKAYEEIRGTITSSVPRRGRKGNSE